MRYDSLTNLTYANIGIGQLLVAIPDNPSNPGGPGRLARVSDSTTGLNTAALAGMKIYRALLTQTSTNAPVATVLENTLGSIVWARSSEGVYTATLTGVFLAGKVFARVDLQPSSFAAAESASIVRTSNDVLTLTTYDADSTDDGNLTATPVEIIVYP